MKKRLSHLDGEGRAAMVDVGAKRSTSRLARASAVVHTTPEVVRAIAGGRAAKGNVTAAARLAGILAAKRTAELIPLCHSLSLDLVEVEVRPAGERVEIEARVRSRGPTGVEMEALTAAAVAALTVYDMCKALDRAMEIGPIRLEEKKGGKSGHWVRAASESAARPALAPEAGSGCGARPGRVPAGRASASPARRRNKGKAR